MNEQVRLTGYQINYKEFTKNKTVGNEEWYKRGIIFVRIEALQSQCMYAKRINKPNASGTKITYEAVISAEEYERELDRIIEDAKEIGMNLEKTER